MSRCGHPARTISAETLLVTEAACSQPRLGQPGHTLRLLASLRSPGLCPRSFPNWGGPPPGTLGDVWGRLWLSHGGCSWHRGGGGTNAARPPTAPRTAPLSDLPSVPSVRGPGLYQHTQALRLVNCPVSSTEPRTSRGALGAAVQPAGSCSRSDTQRSGTRGGKAVRGAASPAHRRGSHASAPAPRGPRPTRPQRRREHVWEPTRLEGARGSGESAPPHGHALSNQVSPRGPRGGPTSAR